MNDVEQKMVEATQSVKAFLDAIAALDGSNPRAHAVARTQFETAFLWAANACGAEGLFDG